MPLIRQKENGMLSNLGKSAWGWYRMIMAIILIVAIVTWNPAWRMILSSLLVVSSGYMIWRLTYFALCEYNLITQSKKKERAKNGQISPEEWIRGTRTIPYRWIWFWLFMVTMNTILITKDGKKTMMMGIIATIILGVFFITQATNSHVKIRKDDCEEVKKVYKTHKKACKSMQKGWVWVFGLLLVGELCLLAMLDDGPKGEIGKLLFVQLWPGLAIIAVSYVGFALTGELFSYFIPAALYLLWYGVEHLIGVQIIPFGDLNTGVDRIMIPAFLAISLVMEGNGLVRKLFFHKGKNDVPIVTSLAQGKLFS